MKRVSGSILAAALVAGFCAGAALSAAAQGQAPAVVAETRGDFQTAQIFNRDLRGRERHIQQFRTTPPPRDNDRFLRERRERPSDSVPSFRDQRGRTRGNEQDRALDAVRRGEVLPLDRIIRGVQQFCPGTFLDATLRERGKQFAYRVTILRPNGRRVTLLVDAQSGAVLRGRCN